MSFLDWFTSTRKPAPGTPVLDPAVVQEAVTSSGWTYRGVEVL